MKYPAFVATERSSTSFPARNKKRASKVSKAETACDTHVCVCVCVCVCHDRESVEGKRRVAASAWNDGNVPVWPTWSHGARVERVENARSQRIIGEREEKARGSNAGEWLEIVEKGGGGKGGGLGEAREFGENRLDFRGVFGNDARGETTKRGSCRAP